MNNFAFNLIDAINRDGLGNESWGVVENVADTVNYFGSLDLVLNGASGWHQYSYGGCALVYNGDIAKVVFTPAQFAKWEQGRKVTAEPLLDIQARALAAGWRVLKSAQRYADMCANLQNRQPDEK